MYTFIHTQFIILAANLWADQRWATGTPTAPTSTKPVRSSSWQTREMTSPTWTPRDRSSTSYNARYTYTHSVTYMYYIHTVHTFIYTTYTYYIHILHKSWSYYNMYSIHIVQYIHKLTTRFTIIYLNQYIHTTTIPYHTIQYKHETFLPNRIFFAFPLLCILEKKQGSGLHSKGCRREGRVRIDKGAAGESGERLEWKKLCIRSLRWACQS